MEKSWKAAFLTGIHIVEGRDFPGTALLPCNGSTKKPQVQS